ADRLHLVGLDLAVGEKLVADEGEILPPVLARTMLGPAGLRHMQLVRLRGGGEDRAVVGDEHALRFEGADVDADIVLHWMKSSRSRLKFRSICGRAAVISWVRKTRWTVGFCCMPASARATSMMTAQAARSSTEVPARRPPASSITFGA